MPSTQTRRKKPTGSKSTKSSSSRRRAGGSTEHDGWTSLLEKAKPLLLVLSCVLLIAYFGRKPSGSTTPALKATAGAATSTSAKAVSFQKPRSPAYEFYFGYASDLMEDRVRKGSSLGALAIGPARVDNFVFEYSIFSKVWKGGVADLVEKTPGEGASAWGLLYEFPKKDIPNLDKQKGIANDDPKYHKISVTVTDLDGYNYKAFTYTVVPEKRKVMAGTPSGVQQYLPSIQYRKCIVNGARGASLPSNYIKMLESIPDNENPFRRKSVGSACD
ncbi:Gamma-glutamylcyclotransferase [Hondaea fermentalgiana]|uniref:gamma-glutamylcyclotransferase n=1 Tax=Hondaea fermentalgiana TaxID=2315210 RepID=A0A2R5GMN5_9STRA|nr:Gamma-glutamylcyclotransferase [Hondaea fermentalgiana]|eukprot:GBG32146.1 Gamma-glutamylcyclotransferase [Hondaea fermentalgiana]